MHVVAILRFYKIVEICFRSMEKNEVRVEIKKCLSKVCRLQR